MSKEHFSHRKEKEETNTVLEAYGFCKRKKGFGCPQSERQKETICIF